ncbi:hypothetical protein PORY_001429 [Pneumocystis oryctolagi]|uniref:Uncharacterized protein n=1 Tax=Pneumocystis oryctolagi TaxID=42067 RepID=A0ACB7CBZ5_9ASCO|nr:hypothetical protein PORY_001429 [Pneumocystis oryctolagi]
MPGHVFILSDSRRYIIKTTPTQSVNDLLLEGCKRAGQLDPQEYILKYGHSILDLSLPIRFVQLPTKQDFFLYPFLSDTYLENVRVALQIIDFEKRLILSFPSQTTLWDILCQFEETENPPINITKRSVSVVSDGKIDYYYETPVVRIMNKEFSEPNILKDTTLSSQGIIEGNIVLQVKFKQTQIYFDQIKSTLPKKEIYKDNEETESQSVSTKPIEQTEYKKNLNYQSKIHQTTPFKQMDSHKLILDREILVFSAPTSSSFYSSKVDTNEEDYEMTLETAISYQNMLSAKAKGLSGQYSNIQQESKQDNFKKHEVKFRLPDGMQVIGTFQGNENVQSLYDFMKHLIQYSEEPFLLYTTPPPKYLLNMKAILASDLNFSTKTTIIFKWDDTAQSCVREHNILKDTYLNLQKDISEIATCSEDKEENTTLPAVVPPQRLPSPPKCKSNSKKIPKWLKLSK